MVKSEIHIVLIWEKGLNKLDHILYDLKNSFRILKVVEMEWSPSYFSSNLSRFYGEKLPDRSFKEKHCGKGPFVCVILEDLNPVYEERKTSKGISLVNKSLFDKKELYRNWTGGGHKVHGSNNLEEAAHDMLFLFNKSMQDYVAKDWDGNMTKIQADIVGYDGWEDFDSLFDFINKSSNYVILRNYKNLDSLKSEKSDIDFLTSNKDFMYHINGNRKHKSRNRVAYTIAIGDKHYDADIRFLDDNYYDYNWAKNIIDDRITYKNFFIPDPLNEFYSLLYHSLIHKNDLSDKYVEELLSISDSIGLDIEKTIFYNREEALDLLCEFLQAKQYNIVKPKDFSVQYSYGRKGLKRFFWELIGKIKNV